MEYIYAMIKLFGERYIFCDDGQAHFDVEHREELVSAYVAIMDYINTKKEREKLIAKMPL